MFTRIIKGVKRNYNAAKLFFILRRFRYWVMTTKSPIKKEICSLMFELSYPTYVSIRPVWLPKVKPLPTENEAHRSVDDMLANIKDDVAKERVVKLDA